MTAQLNAVNVNVVRDTYTGFRYKDTSKVVPLLGMDPARADKNEAVQSNAKLAREADFELWTTAAADVTTWEALWSTKTTFNPDDGTGSHNVIVTKAESHVDVFVPGSTPYYRCAFTVREY